MLGNPVVRRISNRYACEDLSEDVKRATYLGVYAKAALFAAVTIITAVLTEFLVIWAFYNGDIEAVLIGASIAASVGLIPLVIIGFIIAFVPTTAKYLGFVYCILEGGVLGLLVLCVDIMVPGVALAALVGTVLVLFASLVVNYVFRKRISSTFVRGLIVATFSFLIVQFVVGMISIFTPIISGVYFWIEFAACALGVIWATVMLFWDLSNIDNLVQTGAEKKYEWCAAFSLVLTLIYMYLEILELILRIIALFKKD